jgi:hypothetical protein
MKPCTLTALLCLVFGLCAGQASNSLGLSDSVEAYTVSRVQLLKEIGNPASSIMEIRAEEKVWVLKEAGEQHFKIRYFTLQGYVARSAIKLSPTLKDSLKVWPKVPCRFYPPTTEAGLTASMIQQGETFWVFRQTKGDLILARYKKALGYVHLNDIETWPTRRDSIATSTIMRVPLYAKENDLSSTILEIPKGELVHILKYSDAYNVMIRYYAVTGYTSRLYLKNSALPDNPGQMGKSEVTVRDWLHLSTSPTTLTPAPPPTTIQHEKSSIAPVIHYDPQPSSARQCTGTTQKGLRCKNMTTNSSGRCHYH